MHHHYPDPQVLPSPHSRGHQQHQAETPEQDGNSQQQEHQIDDYDLDVGLAGSLQ